MDLSLTKSIIEDVKKEVVFMLLQSLSSDIRKIVMYGSCARGDFSPDSDIDIAILTNSGRITGMKYGAELSRIATDIAMQYYAIVNFICIPIAEFEEKKDWYIYFNNIEKEGIVLYERKPSN